MIDTARAEVDLRNTGNESCVFPVDPTTTGSPFSLDGTLPEVLEPSNQTTLFVLYTPSEVAPSDGTLTVTFAGQEPGAGRHTLSVPLSGASLLHVDAGPDDAGPTDAGPDDAGPQPTDAGLVEFADAGTPQCAAADAGPFPGTDIVDPCTVKNWLYLSGPIRLFAGTASWVRIISARIPAITKKISAVMM